MTDLQSIFNAISEASRNTRSDYHLTLGELRSALESLPDNTPVVTDTGRGIGSEHSYRGYYHDLSFSPSEGSTVAEVRTACERARCRRQTPNDPFCRLIHTPGRHHPAGR